MALLTTIKKMNDTFEKLINSVDDRKLKKADLIAYWIEAYSKYLDREASFDYSKVMRYSRGDIIQVNFGFNIGSEQGGLHYAVVIDNDNLKSSPVITVIPLSSGSEKDAHQRDLYLGNELYEKVNTKYEKLRAKTTKELLVVQQMLKIIDVLRERNSKEISDPEVIGQIEKWNNESKRLEEESKRLSIFEKEVNKLKQGSIALMEQITTISKMRIYQPKNSDDLLYNISFSNAAMDKINKRLMELFIH